jgi:hypothetical protein
MLSSDVRRVFFEELAALGERAGRAPLHRDEARRLFEQLQCDGPIKTIVPLARRAEPILSLAQHHDPSFPVLYGVDGGSTRPMHFEDGTTLCANQAVCITDPPLRHRGFPLEAWRTVAIVSHSFQNIGEAKVTHTQNTQVHQWRIHLTKDFLEREVAQIVKGLADVTSEPTHAQWMLELLDVREGMLIIDGALYPIGLYYYLLGELKGEWGYRWGVRLSDREDIVVLLAAPVRLIEACVARRLPIVAINKTPETSWLLRFCLEERERRWASDRQFMTAVLSDTPKDSLGYTKWFVQEAYPSWEERGAVIDLPKAISDFGLVLEPGFYHVAFFYVYDPRVRSVLKIETPRAVFEFCEPERLQRVMLGEIARGKGVPNVLRKADSRARITQEEREALMRACGLDPDYYYNLSRGEPL